MKTERYTSYATFLSNKDVCKRDMRAGNIDPAGWEEVAEDRSDWRRTVKVCVQRSEELREQQWEERRERRQQKVDSLPSEAGATFTCDSCNRACRSIIGLYSPNRSCSSTTNLIIAQIPLSPETDGRQQP